MYRKRIDFSPEIGVQVFNITDSVTLLYGNPSSSYVKEDNLHLYHGTWPLLQKHFSKLTFKSMGSCKTKDGPEYGKELVRVHAGRNVS